MICGKNLSALAFFTSPKTRGAGDDVGGRCQLADVEFDVPHHSAEHTDLWLDSDEFGIHALDGDGPVANVVNDGDVE
jgi:hypothetical protein